MSQIKGSTIIEVFDAKTNKKLYEQKDDNIVTHAYEKILQDYRGKLGYSMSEMFGSLPSITHALFGGVLLFGSVIPSDANHMLPTDSEMQSFVGCASYAGKITNNNYAGEFSTDESEFTDDHAKFVYNFNTAEANGVINTICLTSAVGGYTGYKQDVYNKYATKRSFINPSTDGNMFLPTYDDSGSSYNVVDGFYVNSSVDKSAVICDSNKSSFHLYGDINKGVNLQKEAARKIILSKVEQTYIPKSRYTNIDALSAKVYEPLISLDTDKLYWVSESDNMYIKNTLTLHYISMTEPETTKTYNITSAHASITQYCNDSNYGYYDCCCIYNGKLYVCVNNAHTGIQGRMYVINLDESSSDCSFVYSDFTINTLMNNGIGGAYFSNDDILFIRVNNTLYMSRRNYSDKTRYYFRVDTDTGAVDSESSTFVYNRRVQYDEEFGKAGIYETYDGIYLVAPYYSGYLSGLLLPSGYLASINNLQNAVNKTAERTLKITYTLTYE